MRVRTFIPYLCVATYFRKPDIRAKQFSDFSDAETIAAICFHTPDDACYDFYSVSLWRDNFPKQK